MRHLLDFISLIIFFLIYRKVDIFYAYSTLMITTTLSTLTMYLIYKKIEKTSLITSICVIIFGGLTLIFHNDIFIKWKVTIIYTIFSLMLLFSQFFIKKPLLQKMLSKEIYLAHKIWNRLNISWAVFFATCAIINIYVAFWFSQEVWVKFKVFGLTIITLLFAIFNVIYIYNNLSKKHK
ncbi:MAG: septation protein A [Arsenophonus sp.]